MTNSIQRAVPRRLRTKITTPAVSGVQFAAGERPSRVLSIGLWAVTLYFLVPLLWLLISTFKNDNDLYNTFGLWFGHMFALPQNLVTTFTQENGAFSLWFVNTVWYAVASATGATVLSALAGYAFAKFRFRGRRALFSIILGAIMIPGTAIALPTYLLFSGAGLVNTPLAVILPSIINPFAVYLMRVYTEEAVDDSLLEAARIDGAGELRIFAQVAARLIGPAMVTVFLFSLVASWNNYFLPLIMLSNSSLYPMTVGLAQWAASSSAGGGARIVTSSVLTGSVVSIAPLVVAFLFLQRFWQTGLSTGGVKG